MNHIDLAKNEVVIVGDLDLTIDMTRFKMMMEGFLNEEDVHFSDVSMDIGESEVYFFNDETEIAVMKAHVMDIAMHLI